MVEDNKKKKKTCEKVQRKSEIVRRAELKGQKICGRERKTWKNKGGERRARERER